jgi:hypothetical protein
MRHPEKGTNVTHPELSAKTLRATLADFAVLRASLLRIATRASIAALAIVSIAVLSAPAPAVADARIGAEGLPLDGPGGIVEPQGLAVSRKEGGDVYVTSTAASQRIDQFEPDGTFVRAFGWGVVPGAAEGNGNLTAGSTSVTEVTTTGGRFLPGDFIAGPAIPAGTQIESVSGTELILTHPPTESDDSATLSVAAGPGNVPTDEIQTVTLGGSPTGGTLTLGFTSPEPGATTATTAPVRYDADAGEVEEALEALPAIGAGDVSVAGSPGGPWTVEFKGRYADTNVRRISAESAGLTPSGSATVATPTQGAGVLETCTTVCTGESTGEGEEFGQGSQPGQLRWSDEIAVDNDPASESYGDVYVVDQRNFRVEKYSPSGEFLLIFGGDVDQGPHHPGNLCTAAYIAEGDTCGAGRPGTGPGFFRQFSGQESWANERNNSIAIGPEGTVYVGDYGRVQEFEPDGAYKGQLSFPEAAFVGSLAVDAAGHAYAASNAQNEGQVVSNLPSSGTYTLSFEGRSTTPLKAEIEPGSDTESKIVAALEALSTIGHGNVNVELGTFPGAKRIESIQIEFVGSLARKNLPPLEVSSGTVETTHEGAASELVELGPSSEVLQSFDPSGQPTHIALDAEGDLFVSDPNGEVRGSSERAFVFRAFRPTGALYAEFTSDQVTNSQSETMGLEEPGTTRADGLAADAASGKLYVTTSKLVGARGREETSQKRETYVAVIPLPEPGPPVVSEESTADVQAKTATLQAIVNPSEFDTEYRFQYVTQKHFAEEGFEHAEETAFTDLGSLYHSYPVRAAISGLDPGTIYHYRALAKSAHGGATTVDGPDQTFETLPAVSVREFTTQLVAPERVTLRVELNNNNSLQAGHYTICIGPEAGHYTECSEGVLPTGSGEFKAVEATFTGLQPNTAYHYQLTAENENTEPGHALKTADAEFTTEPSASEERQAELAECPNVNLREENGSAALPDCRAYEQASPPNKEGGEAYPTTSLAPSGERVLYQSNGVFADAQSDELTVQYLAERTPSGWVTQAPVRRLGSAGTVSMFEKTTLLFSPELDRWLTYEVPALNREQGNVGEAREFYFSLSLLGGANVLHASPTLKILEGPARTLGDFWNTGASLTSEDLSTNYAFGNTRLLPGPDDPRPDNENDGLLSVQSSRLYELSGLGGATPALKLVAEVPLGLSPLIGGGITGCSIDDEATLLRGGKRLVSADGSTVIYTAPIEGVAGRYCGEGTPNPIAVFAHHAEVTVQLNAPASAQCQAPSPCSGSHTATPEVDGMSPDGARVWFTTTQPLIDSDTDQTTDLYMAKLDPETGQLIELVQATAGELAPGHPTPGDGARVTGVLSVSPDGTHVAFTAQGVLTAAPNQLGQSAELGAQNLYVYDAATGEIKFVTDKFGEVKSHTGGNEADLPAHFTPGGNYLVIATSKRLTSDDTDSAQDIYRYDFQIGQLIRLSFGRDGNDANGNDGFNAVLLEEPNLGAANNLAEDSTRAVSADGSVVIFQTSAPLVSRDTNGAPDIYEWEEQGHGSCHQNENGSGGCVRLISDGLDPHGANWGVIGSSGRDIIFQTQRGEAPGDTDGVGDIYDARIDGGFPYSTPGKSCGSNETCHGPVPPEPAPPTLGTPGFVGPGNESTQLQCAKGKVRVTKHGQVRCVAKKHHKAKHHKKHRQGGASKRSRSDSSAPRAKTKHLQRAAKHNGGGNK